MTTKPTIDFRELDARERETTDEIIPPDPELVQRIDEALVKAGIKRLVEGE